MNTLFEIKISLKLIFKITLMTFLIIPALGQKVDYNTIILPKGTSNLSEDERLVQLAWQNSPESQILDHLKASSSLRVKQAQRNWLDNVRITGNLNEYNIQSLTGNDQNNLFFPRYNISASISLGAIFTDPIRVKVEKENLQIAIENINKQKLALRAEVLSRYETYKKSKEIYELRVQILNDSENELKLREESFKRDEIPLSDYHNAVDRRNMEKISTIQAEKEFLLSRFRLEELIGVKLSEIGVN